MMPRLERRVRRILWAASLLMGLGALGLGLAVVAYPPTPRPLPAQPAVLPDVSSLPSKAELDAFAQRKMSRGIVKVVQPSPPKPAAPALDTLVRLSGIMDYGPNSPREAFLEVRSSSQTKGYRAGDSLAAHGILVKSITEGVVVEYDGKLWMLTDKGAQVLPPVPAGPTGAKP